MWPSLPANLLPDRALLVALPRSFELRVVSRASTWLLTKPLPCLVDFVATRVDAQNDGELAGDDAGKMSRDSIITRLKTSGTSGAVVFAYDSAHRAGWPASSTPYASHRQDV